MKSKVDIATIVVGGVYLWAVIGMLVSGNSYARWQWGLCLLGAIAIMFLEGFFTAMAVDLDNAKKDNKAMNPEQVNGILEKIMANLNKNKTT